MITDKDGNNKLIPIVDSALQQQPSEQQDIQQNHEEVTCQTSAPQTSPPVQPSSASPAGMPRKTGSLSIMFRKVSIIIMFLLIFNTFGF